MGRLLATGCGCYYRVCPSCDAKKTCSLCQTKQKPVDIGHAQYVRNASQSSSSQSVSRSNLPVNMAHRSATHVMWPQSKLPSASVPQRWMQNPKKGLTSLLKPYYKIETLPLPAAAGCCLLPAAACSCLLLAAAGLMSLLKPYYKNWNFAAPAAACSCLLLAAACCCLLLLLQRLLLLLLAAACCCLLLLLQKLLLLLLVPGWENTMAVKDGETPKLHPVNA